MALITFVSAKGSPGVSKMVNVGTRMWGGGAVRADLDPAGGDAILLQKSATGGPLDPNHGLVSLGTALRGGKQDEDLEQHLQDTDEGYRLLTGVTTPMQVHALGPVWPSIARLLKNYGADVIADVGRFELGSPVQPIIEEADAVVFVARDDVASLGHLRQRLATLSDPLSIGRRGGPAVAIALVGQAGNGRAVDDAVRLLASSGLSVSSLGMVAWDPGSVAKWERIAEGRRRRSVYHRSLVDVFGRLRALVGSQDVSSVQNQGG